MILETKSDDTRHLNLSADPISETTSSIDSISETTCRKYTIAAVGSVSKLSFMNSILLSTEPILLIIICAIYVIVESNYPIEDMDGTKPLPALMLIKWKL